MVPAGHKTKRLSLVPQKQFITRHSIVFYDNLEQIYIKVSRGSVLDWVCFYSMNWSYNIRKK